MANLPLSQAHSAVKDPETGVEVFSVSGPAIFSSEISRASLALAPPLAVQGGTKVPTHTPFLPTSHRMSSAICNSHFGDLGPTNNCSSYASHPSKARPC